jgi:NTP pyrophosphatase (non-canonical NTP hydrolase)
MSNTPADDMTDPDGPGWRTLGEREVIQPGDMWKDIDGNWRETKYGPKTRWRVTAADYYRRRIETPEPTRVEIPADSKMNEVADKIGYRLYSAEISWAEDTNLCSVNDVPGCKQLMRNIMLAGMTYLQDSITAWAIRKGWLTETRRNPAEQLMLIVTELAEACEAFRVGNPPCERPGMEQYSHAAEELADVVIRCFQMAGEHDIPLADVILAKMAFNETRPVKHGKQF